MEVAVCLVFFFGHTAVTVNYVRRDENIHGTIYGAAEQMRCLSVFMKALGDDFADKNSGLFFLIQVTLLDDLLGLFFKIFVV